MIVKDGRRKTVEDAKLMRPVDGMVTAVVRPVTEFVDETHAALPTRVPPPPAMLPRLAAAVPLPSLSGSHSSGTGILVAEPVALAVDDAVAVAEYVGIGPHEPNCGVHVAELVP